MTDQTGWKPSHLFAPRAIIERNDPPARVGVRRIVDAYTNDLSQRGYFHCFSGEHAIVERVDGSVFKLEINSGVVFVDPPGGPK